MCKRRLQKVSSSESLPKLGIAFAHSDAEKKKCVCVCAFMIPHMTLVHLDCSVVTSHMRATVFGTSVHAQSCVTTKAYGHRSETVSNTLACVIPRENISTHKFGPGRRDAQVSNFCVWGQLASHSGDEGRSVGLTIKRAWVLCSVNSIMHLSWHHNCDQEHDSAFASGKHDRACN